MILPIPESRVELLARVFPERSAIGNPFGTRRANDAGEIKIGERKGTPKNDRARVTMRVHAGPSVASDVATKMHEIRACGFNLHIASRIIFEDDSGNRQWLRSLRRCRVTSEKKKESKLERTHREPV